MEEKAKLEKSKTNEKNVHQNIVERKFHVIPFMIFALK